MSAKFGTSGLRGLNEDLIGETAISYTKAFVQYLVARRLIFRGDAVFVARDFRTSSPKIFENIVEALQAEGMGFVDCGQIPTPALAFAAMRRGSAAIMITGSHIPDDRNGLKFYKPTGEIDKRDEKGIVKFHRNPSSVAARHLARPASQSGIPTGEGGRDFKDRFLSAFPSAPLKGSRIGIYQHSTVARDVLVEILQALGAEVTPLGRAEEFVAVDTEAVTVAVQEKLLGWCKTGAFDAIVSADGDGDRPLVADENGKVIRGDVLGLIAAKALGAQTIVTPITSNSGLENATSGQIIRTKVGSPHVIAAMYSARKKGKKAIVGFEANGGFFTASHFGKLKPLPTRDCVLPILLALISAKKAGKKLSTNVAEYDLPICLSDTLVVPSFEIAQDVSARLLSDKQSFEIFGTLHNSNRLDGLRLTFVGGSVLHLRPSGNAPEFRIYVEGVGQAQAEVVLAKGRVLITQMFSLR